MHSLRQKLVRSGIFRPAVRSLCVLDAMACYPTGISNLEANKLVEKPMNQQRRYLSYLLRLWQESADLPPDGVPPGRVPPDGDPPLWRASLEGPSSEELMGFASLADLFAFLECQTRLRSPDAQHPDEDDG